MAIYLCWMDTDIEVLDTYGKEWGRAPKVRTFPIVRCALWSNDVSAAQLESARKYAATDNRAVVVADSKKDASDICMRKFSTIG